VEKEVLLKYENSFYRESLHLPHKNDMLATDFTLKDYNQYWKEPRVILDTNIARVWYKKDQVFKKPKLNVCIKIVTPITFVSPKASVLVYLYIQILQDYCTEFSYQSSM